MIRSFQLSKSGSISCGLCNAVCLVEAISLRVKPEGLQSLPETYLFMRSSSDLEKELAENRKALQNK